MDKRKTKPSKTAARGRPRNEQAREAILKASLKLVDSAGYKALTVDRIAAEAGVGKQTIYRWWKSKAEVVLEAFTAYVEEQSPLPDTGSFRADLETFLRNMVDGFAAVSGPTVRALIAETLVNPEFRRAYEETFAARRQVVLEKIIRRGLKRGEIRKGTNVRLAMDMIYGPVWHRFLHQTAPVNRRFAKRFAGHIVAGLSP